MKKNQNTNYRKRCLACLMFVVFSFGFVSAQTLYDGKYNRPSYFAGWTQPSDWQNVMFYFAGAYLNEGDARISNYEVAVYDQNDKLRHCSRSIAADDDICTLTIPGVEGDTFHFKIIFGDPSNPTIMDVKETCEFVTNDMQGTLSSPFRLTVAGHWLGDVNKDDNVTIADVAALVGALLGKTATNDRSDVNQDRSVNLSDVKALADIILGKREKTFVK